MRRRLVPILVDDEEPEKGKVLRDSVVSPARRSPSADFKAMRKQTTDGDPVHSFQTLLKDLAVICRNRIRPMISVSSITGNPMEFDVVTLPTPLQRRAFDLPGVPLSVYPIMVMAIMTGHPTVCSLTQLPFSRPQANAMRNCPLSGEA